MSPNQITREAEIARVATVADRVARRTGQQFALDAEKLARFDSELANRRDRPERRSSSKRGAKQ